MTLLDIQYMLGNLSFACLLAMVVWYWIRLTFSLNPSLVPVGTVGMATANLSLAGLLLARWFTSGHFPLSNLYESLLFLSWGFTAFHLIMEIISRSDLFGIVTSPVALLTHAFASFSLPKEMQKTTALVPALQSNWLMMHVTVMMISYVALISGSLLALAFLVVNYYDKKTLENSGLPGLTASQGFGVPSDGFGVSLNGSFSPFAQTLDNLSYRTLGLGFPLLTIGILSGAVWANEAWGSYWSWDPKETWALITWLVFAIYLHTRLSKGWRGNKPALIAVAGFFVVWICYLGVNLLGTGLHSYGWFQARG
nr:cytochrome c biogenesis protein [Coccomyxa sp. SUA001]